MYNYDHLLSERLKFGAFQLRTFSIVSFIDFLDGAEIQFLSFLNVILLKEWELDMTGLVLLAGSLNFGLFIGAIICIFVADRYGRRNVIVIGSFVQFITVLFTAFAQNLWQMLVLKVMYGIIFGVTIPLSQVLMTECTPLDKRGKTIVSLQIMFILGRIWIVCLALIFFTSLSEGNWRAIALLNSLPCLICFFGSLLYVDESARFLICTGRFDEGVANCNSIGKQNDSRFEELTSTEIDQLREWQATVFHSRLQSKSIKGLFNRQNLPVTWRIWILGIIQSIVFGAIFLLLPFIMADENKSVLQYLYTVIIEIPAVVIVFLLIDNPTWGGRTRMIILGSCCQAAMLWVVWAYKDRYLVSGITMFKFFTRIVGLAFVPLVNESYDTVYRSMGIGAVQCVTRVSASLAPLIFFPIYQRDKYAMFLYAFFGKLFMIGIISTYPSDLTQKPLDEEHDRLDKTKHE